MSDKYGYIGIERLLNFCENTKDHSVTPNDFMRMPRIRPDDFPGQWISVKKRLPKKYIGEWICCTVDGNIMILPYDTPGDGSKECVFYYWEDDYTVVKPNVIAWMPLPEPYRGDDHDEG